MKKKFVLFLMMCCIALFSAPLSHADDFNTIKNKIINDCVEAGPVDELPHFLIVKICQCTVEKAIKKYSPDDLNAATNNQKEIEGLSEEITSFGRECIEQIQNEMNSSNH